MRNIVGMKILPRLYDAVLQNHLARYRQMAFVSGPRQVGKTTVCRALGDEYLDWDNSDVRRLVMAGPAVVARHLGLERLRNRPLVAVFDELHKHRRWKTFLKGFFDEYESKVRLLVTGSSRLDVYRRGGDSLMGRYFPFRIHPFSVGEILHTDLPVKPVRPPRPIPSAEFKALWEHGGFPEPFTLRDRNFSGRWRTLRKEQLLRQDLRDLTRIQDLAEVEQMAAILSERSATALVQDNLARTIGVSVDTVRRWTGTLLSLHFGFLVRPWTHSIARSLLKEPKWYLRDWSGIEDPGARAETFVACHLLKSVEGWNDLGFGEFELRYLRDKDKREVDFLVVRDRKPWFLVEVKSSDANLSPSLAYFQKRTGAPHAFQAVFDMEPVIADCFKERAPVAVPTRTLLSQLL